MAKWRRHSVEFKKQAVDRMRQCDNIEALARELQIERKLLYTWKWQSAGRAEARHADLSEIAERKFAGREPAVEGSSADKVLELDFFKGAFRRIKDAALEAFSRNLGRLVITPYDTTWNVITMSDPPESPDDLRDRRRH